VTDAHLGTALDQLMESRNQLTRVLLGGEQPSAPGSRRHRAVSGPGPSTLRSCACCLPFIPMKN